MLCFITWTMLWIYWLFFILPKMSKVFTLANEKWWVDTWQNGRAGQARGLWIIVFVSLFRLCGPGLRLGRLPQTVWCWSCSPEVLSSGENPAPSSPRPGPAGHCCASHAHVAITQSSRSTQMSILPNIIKWSRKKSHLLQKLICWFNWFLKFISFFI